jgi:hypothetical protein
MCMYLHVSCMYHVGRCRNVMLCTLTLVMTVSLGCIHDDVRADDVRSAQHCPGRGQIGTRAKRISAGDHCTIPEACTAARTRAIHWTCGIVRAASQAWTVPCSTSTYVSHGLAR